VVGYNVWEGASCATGGAWRGARVARRMHGLRLLADVSIVIRGVSHAVESSELSSQESKVRGRRREMVSLYDFSDSSLSCRVLSPPSDCIVAIVMMVSPSTRLDHELWDLMALHIDCYPQMIFIDIGNVTGYAPLVDVSLDIGTINCAFAITPAAAEFIFLSEMSQILMRLLTF
jgi:hypothetical protein